MFHPFRDRKRAQLRERPLPAAWAEILAKNAPFLARLGDAERARLVGDLQIFAEEKTFIGGGGLEITDEHRVTISASAARLILHLDLSLYDDLTEIVVHPSAYVAPAVPNRRAEPVGESARLGESQPWGVVVLAWDAVLAGLRDPRDGHDVVLHELAHVIDKVDHVADGAPPLRAREHFRPWAAVMMRRYEELRAGERAASKVLNDYGATNPAEFFAVATEAYFEHPELMKKHTPDLWAELHQFYGDPAGS